MDTSEIYIKMCEKAEEIQESLSKNEGYLLPKQDFTDQPYPYAAIWDGHPSCPKCTTWLETPYCPKCGSKVQKFVGTPYIAYGGACPKSLKEDKVVWLPRQDQLQGMYSNDLSTLLHDFIGWLDQGDSDSMQCVSMEQLWLAFVMKEKYNKVWADGEWI